MALTPTDIKAGFQTDLPDSEIQDLIDFMAAADDCLTKNSVPTATQDLLKKYAIRHLLLLQGNSGRGEVSSERAPSGASRSYREWNGTEGLSATRYGALLKQMDRYGCIRAVVENNKRLELFVSGPKRVKGEQERFG